MAALFDINDADSAGLCRRYVLSGTSEDRAATQALGGNRENSEKGNDISYGMKKAYYYVKR